MSEPHLYDELIMDHIKNARNYSVPAGVSHHAAASNPLCGDEMVVYLNVIADAIADVGFQCTCCGISMASASIMTEMVKGRSLRDAELLIRDFGEMVNDRAGLRSPPSTQAWRAILDTVTRFPARMRCAMLPWATLDAALKGSREA